MSGTSILRILCHNAFWLQGTGFPSTDPPDPDPAVFAGLVELYRRQGAHLLCLQEVQTPQVAAELGRRLGMTAHFSPGVRHPQYGACILADASVRVRSVFHATQGVQRIRQVLGASLPDGSLLTLAHVHLPSGRQEGPAAAVAMQAAEIRAALEQRPDIVLGDFNPQQDGSPLDQFRESGYADLAELFDAADVGTATDGKAGKRNDRAYVAPRLRGRVSDYAVIGRDELLLQDGRHLSDHLPLRFTVTAADG